MNKIKTKINFLFFIFVAGFCCIFYYGSKNYFQLTDAITLYEQSLDIEYLINQSNQKKYSKEIYDKLVENRKLIFPKNRKELLSRYIQAYTSANYTEQKNRAFLFIKQEKPIRDNIIVNQDILKNRIMLSAIVLGCLFFFMIIMAMFLYHTLVFSRINNLSKRMIDFLHNKYSYQFILPNNDEVGELHGTFNALAQRVLNNIEELKALDSAKSEFLNIASHELRTPLTSIKGSLSLLASGVGGELPKKSQRLVSIAENESDRLIRLINDLLDLAKIEARHMTLNRRWTNINELIDKTFESLHGISKQADVNLVRLSNEELEVYLDPDRFQQVLTNLISNALKYSPKGENVVISYRILPEVKKFLIQVSDKGPGIAKEDQNTIFQKFRQATSAQSPLVKGTGLGLAIVQAVMDQHGGEVGIESIQGEGSSFYCLFKEWRRISEPNHPKNEKELNTTAQVENESKKNKESAA